MAVLVLGAALSVVRAGSVVTLGSGSESVGKLSLTADSIRVETNASPTEINLADILEAHFGEVPFELDFARPDLATQLPAAWKAQDIGDVLAPGSAAVADETLVLSGGGAAKPRAVADNIFFAGLPWSGNGQWTVHLKEISSGNPQDVAGLMLRDTLAADSALVDFETTPQGNGRVVARLEAGKPLQGTAAPTDGPSWLRLTRYDTSVFAALSSDGSKWDLMGLDTFKTLANPWIGMFVGSLSGKTATRAAFDHISLTPPPSSAEVLPPGVLLEGGTFLAGVIERLVIDPDNPSADGSFLWNGKSLGIARSRIAAIVMLPIARSQLADMNARVGLLMKNGDVMDGDFSSINRNEVVVSSVLLGVANYSRADVLAAFLQPVAPQPGTYEIRLHDGSSVNATSVSSDGQQATLADASGMNLTVPVDEIAQIRAGTAQVQSLAEVSWKATPPALPASPATPVAPAPSTNAAAAAPPPAVSPEPASVAQAWQGENQEQIIEAAAGTTLEFPLAGKFRAVGVRIALASDSAPNSSAVIRVLADGREVARTPAFRAGDQPRFMEVTLGNAKTVSLKAESVFTGTKVFFIDPVAIRAH